MTDLKIDSIIPAGKTKAEFIEDILLHMSDMHSIVEIVPSNGGFALIRAYEIDDSMLEEYGLPEAKELGWTSTLDEMHDGLIRIEGPCCNRKTTGKAQQHYKL